MIDDDFGTDDTEIESSEQVTEQTDLRASLESAFDEAVSEESETPEETAQRLRDEKGRFSKAQTSEQGEQDPATLPPVLPPSSWAADKRESFNRMPRDLQEEVVRRDTDLRRYLTAESEKLAHAQRTYADIDEAVAPYRDQFARAGVSHGAVFKQMMSWQQYLDSNPEQALNDLAQSYGLDLRQLAQNVEGQAQPVPSYVSEMRQQLQQMQGYFGQQQQMQRAWQQQQIEAEVQSFAGERDQSGQPLRPYLENVLDDMMSALPMLKAQSPQASNREILQHAYDRAVWANPNTRAYELQRQQATTQQAQRAKSEQAKRAAKLVNGHAPSAFTPNPPTDLRSALLAAWDDSSGN